MPRIGAGREGVHLRLALLTNAASAMKSLSSELGGRGYLHVQDWLNEALRRMSFFSPTLESREKPVTLTLRFREGREEVACGFPSFLGRHHFVAPGFELRAWKPGRKLVCLCNLTADFEEQPGILHGAGQVPRRIHFVGDLMVMV